MNGEQIAALARMTQNHPIIAMRGIPGSGKSTIARQLAKELDATIISRDTIRYEILHLTNSTPNPKTERMVTQIHDDLITKALSEGKTAIIDNTNIHVRDIKNLEQFGVPLFLINVCADLDVALQRNEGRQGVKRVPQEVIEKMYWAKQQNYNDINNLAHEGAIIDTNPTEDN